MIPLTNKDIGDIGEALSLLILPRSKKANENNPSHPFDSITEDNFTVNTKMAKLRISKAGKGQNGKHRGSRKNFVFFLHAWTAEKCDFYLLIGYKLKNGMPVPLIAWFIPSSLLHQDRVNIGLSNQGKFKDYVINDIDFKKLLRKQQFVNTVKIIINKRRQEENVTD